MSDSSSPQPQPGRPGGVGRYAGPDSGALVLCGARLADGRTVDVRLGGGCIEAVGTAGSLAPQGARVDLAGYLLLPAPAEPHAHCDTALTADAEGPASGSPEDVQRRTTEAALLQLGTAPPRRAVTSGSATSRACVRWRRCCRPAGHCAGWPTWRRSRCRGC